MELRKGRYIVYTWFHPGPPCIKGLSHLEAAVEVPGKQVCKDGMDGDSRSILFNEIFTHASHPGVPSGTVSRPCLSGRANSALPGLHGMEECQPGLVQSCASMGGPSLPNGYGGH